MRKLYVIGIGAGDPEQVTMQAIRTMNLVDVFFFLNKGDAKDDLLRIRKEICDRYIESDDYRTVEFDGSIASMVNHGSDKAIWDILVHTGKAGTNFEFAGVGIFPGGNAQGEMNLPANSATPTQGDKLHIVAKVDNFNATQCLLFLTPVSTTVTK